MINERKLDSASALSQQALVEFPNDPEAHYAVGKVKMLSGKTSVAISFYEKLLDMPTLKNYTKSWTLHDLAICYFTIGNPVKAECSLNASLELRATKNVINSALQLARILGFDPAFHSWKKYETSHFVFHFQEELDEIQNFIAQKEQAFNQINSFFNASLPKKIDYFVWSDEPNAQLFLKKTLAFTNPGLSLTHTSAAHTVGHEMTHTISHFAVDTKKSHKLISEGVCVNFDLSNRNNIEILKKLGFNSSIEAIWKNEIPARDDIIYPLAGELVKRLIKVFGAEKFMQLLSDQTFQNATRIYGTELSSLIHEIEDQVR